MKNKRFFIFFCILGLAFFVFHDTMIVQILMEVLTWLIRSVLLASAAALAQMLAPSVLFPRATLLT